MYKGNRPTLLLVWIQNQLAFDYLQETRIILVV